MCCNLTVRTSNIELRSAEAETKPRANAKGSTAAQPHPQAHAVCTALSCRGGARAERDVLVHRTPGSAQAAAAAGSPHSALRLSVTPSAPRARLVLVVDDDGSTSSTRLAGLHCTYSRTIHVTPQKHTTRLTSANISNLKHFPYFHNPVPCKTYRGKSRKEDFY